MTKVIVLCPSCGEPMTSKKHGKYECTNAACKDKYIAVPASIFGVTQD